MHSRRSFFSRLGAIAAIVALSPQLAFARKLDQFVLDRPPTAFWTQTIRWERVTSDAYREALNRLMDTSENDALMRA